ncbi:MAG: acyltransferase [Megasphaera sp.]|nr:acyltransferase [Megasphaera sp.]MCH4187452.1 acyltransferase [Megasphaera sp.]MCH4217371.1 acyltransferase [Megasphaera sp.]
MSKRFINSINYMRGLCMLGVIAIHVGSVALTSPAPNLGLVAVLEILSRFSVPAFFFLSAFGMFYSQPLAAPFVYKDYLKRRLRTVLVPYIAWSLFYMVYTSILSHNFNIFQPYTFFKTIWYGLAMYHIYFLVILLWFYFLMPLWRPLLRFMDKNPWLWFSILFVGNMIFNFYSSYIWTVQSANPLIQDAFNYRLNYVVLHYLFIFMFGALTAEHFQAITNWLSHHGILINVFQGLTTASMLAGYYGIMHYMQYDALSAVFTIHQLSPMGMAYTLSTMLFLLYWWECRSVPACIHRLFTMLGNYSYPIYLVHPVFLSICTGLCAHMHLYLRAWHIVLIYGIVAVLAAGYSAVINKLPLPHWLNICLKGK